MADLIDAVVDAIDGQTDPHVAARLALGAVLRHGRLLPAIGETTPSPWRASVRPLICDQLMTGVDC